MDPLVVDCGSPMEAIQYLKVSYSIEIQTKFVYYVNNQESEATVFSLFLLKHLGSLKKKTINFMVDKTNFYIKKI